MKFTKRLLLLSLCFAFLCSVSFPVNVSASNDTETQIYSTLYYGSNLIIQGMVYPDDDTRQTLTNNVSLNGYTKNTVYYNFYLSNRDKTSLFDSGEYVKGTIDNIYIVGSAITNIATYSLSFTDVSVSFIYTDGTQKTIGSSIYKSGEYYTVDFGGDTEKAVSQIYVQMSTKLSDYINSSTQFTLNATLGEPSKNVEVNDYITFNALNWSYDDKGLFDKLIDTIENVSQNMWNLISDGLKGLFVPDIEFIKEYVDSFNVLSEEKFGCLFQAFEIIVEFAERITVYDETDTIELPEVTIPLGDTSFTFGGYSVRIVPEGFEFLVGSVKAIAGIVGTFYFVGGLRKRYDEAMGVEK